MNKEKTCNDCKYKRPCPCGEDDCGSIWCNLNHRSYNEDEVLIKRECFEEKEKK